MPSSSVKYQSLEELNIERDAVAWYWRAIALVSSFMILGGYLILPTTFDNDPKLRDGFTIGIISILIVTTLTTGYSFTALLCFACRNWRFQVESVFLPALTSSIIGLLTVMWCFAATTHYKWNTAATVTTALSTSASVIYSILLFITHRKINNCRKQFGTARNSLSDTYYKNYLANMYPSAVNSGETLAPTDDDRVNHSFALLLKKHDPGLSPEACQSTFRIDLPEEPVHESMGREMPPSAGRPARHAVHHAHRTPPSQSAPMPRGAFGRIASTLSGHHRGRSGNELTVNDGRGRESSRTSHGSRAMSREERRREIELGTM